MILSNTGIYSQAWRLGALSPTTCVKSCRFFFVFFFGETITRVSESFNGSTEERVRKRCIYVDKEEEEEEEVVVEEEEGGKCR